MGVFGPSKAMLKIDGYKTYIVVAAALILGAVDGLGIFNVPNWAFELLPFFGLGTLRHAINKAKDAAQDAAKVANQMNVAK